MSANHEYRIQTGNVAPPAAGVVKVYANASGYLQFVTSGSVTGSASSAFSQNVSQVNGTPPATGVTQLSAMASPSSGAYIGSTGGYAKPVFLAQPDQWLVISAPSGGKYVVPGYIYT